jgi:hypothetical protein
LESGVLFDRAGVMDICEDLFASARRYGITGEFEEQVGYYPFTMVAQVSFPSFLGGENLATRDVALEGDFGYVSYNTARQDYVLAVEVINISDPNNPVVISRL